MQKQNMPQYLFSTLTHQKSQTSSLKDFHTWSSENPVFLFLALFLSEKIPLKCSEVKKNNNEDLVTEKIKLKPPYF